MSLTRNSGPEFFLREGFWSTKADRQTSSLPFPKARIRPFLGKEEFLKALIMVESCTNSRFLHSVHYRGWSTCRCCGQHNGSSEYVLRYGGMSWRWPIGFSHYVEKHNVRPSLAFEEFIIWFASQDDCTTDGEEQ